jgi:hypothetical protein
MGRRNFHGTVVTLADACDANYLVIVKCERCCAWRQMHPYRLIQTRKRLTTALLNVPLPGFYCRTCRSSVSVIVTCTHRRSGEF